MAFATADDFATLVNRTLSQAETDQVELLLDLATGAIKGWTHQQIELVEEDVVLLAGTWADDLELPERPVVAVSSVKVNGVAIAGEGWAWNERQLLRQGGERAFDSPPGLDWTAVVNGPSGSGLSWAGPAATIEVTYDHGFEEIPEDVRVACLSIAMRYQVIYASGADLSAGFSLTEDDKALLRKYRRWWG